MKRIGLIMAAFFLSVGITACTAESRGYTKAALEPGQAAEAEKDGQGTRDEIAETSKEETKAAGGTEESQTQPQQESGQETQGASAQAGAQAEVTGVVEDASMNTLTVKAEDGTSYRFSTMDADVQAGEEGLILGDKVTVTYETGEGDMLTAVKVVVSTVE